MTLPDTETRDAFGGAEWLPFWLFAQRRFPELRGKPAYDAVMALVYSGALIEKSAPGRGSGTLVAINPKPPFQGDY
jgi:hypothetical protein